MFNILYLNELTEEQAIHYFNSQLYKEIVNTRYKYTKSTIEYYSSYFGNDYSNYSLIIYKNNEPVLVSYSYSSNICFQFFEEPIEILSIKIGLEDEQRVHKMLIEEWEKIFKKFNVKQIKFYANKFLNAKYYNSLIKTEIQYNLMLNLDLPENLIHAGIRKSFRSLINWGKKNLLINIIDSKNCTEDNFNLFKELHRKVSGRQTRSDQTWKKQFEAIKLNEAVLILSEYEGVIVGATFIMLGLDIAYYGVGAYDRDLMEKNLPISHFAIYSSILFLKNLNIKYFNLGYILKESTTEKEKNIFNFKKGFLDYIDYQIINTSDLIFL